MNIEFESVTKDMLYLEFNRKDKNEQEKGLLFNTHKSTPFWGFVDLYSKIKEYKVGLENK